MNGSERVPVLSKVIVVGARGNVGSKLCEKLFGSNEYVVVARVDPSFNEMDPDERAKLVGQVYYDVESAYLEFKDDVTVIWIDFTSPTAAQENVTFYVRHNLPFIIGTTGWDNSILDDPTTLGAPCVVASNMSPRLVALQAMLEYGAERFRGVFSGFDSAIDESHRKGKADTSGTAKVWGALLEKMGARFPTIRMFRDEERAHGYHWYRLWKGGIGRDAVQIDISTKIDDQYEYIEGVMMAIDFLAELITIATTTALGRPDLCRVYSMVEVLEDLGPDE